MVRNEVTADTIIANRHFMHGSGIAIGDVDNDGWPDVFVARLIASDVLYRNLGNWRFEDVTEQAGLLTEAQATTGAVLADIDGDHDLDLLTTMMTGPNAVWLNDGTGRFSSASDAAGLQSSRSSTTMTLADVDGDADLDLYVARYKRISLADSLPRQVLTWENVLADSSFNVKPEFQSHYVFRKSGTRVIRSELAEPDALFLNDGTGNFQLQSWTEGRFLDAAGRPLAESPQDWALTARFFDVNGDRIPDLYICNDFDSPDAFYLGQEGGTFQQVPAEAMRKTSNATMSVDFSDINRDGHMDFFMTDMLSRDYSMRQRQRNTRIPEEILPGDLEFRPQEMQNMLMLSRGDETWAEIARLAGLAASDWSWATSFLDVDLDGYEDILITTGHVFDVQDKDAQAWESRQLMRTRPWQDERRLLLNFPDLQLPNVVFRNKGDLTFEDMPDGWGMGTEPDISHGMALGDLDLDGDLDVVTNRLNDAPGVYRNTGSASRLAIRLIGNAPNTAGVGAKVSLFCSGLPDQQKEITSGGMYLSGSQMQITFAANKGSCRLEVHWRAGGLSVVPVAKHNHLYEIYESGKSSAANDTQRAETPALFSLKTTLAVPKDELYDDFARQPLLPWHLSRYSPAIAVLDVDSDGLDDIVMGGGQHGVTTVHGSRIGSVELEVLPGEVTSVVGAQIGIALTRLFVTSSNYERSPEEASDSSWIYVYDLTSDGAYERHSRLLFGSAAPGPLSLFDADLDGDLDLFAGGHFMPGRYPEPVSSVIFLNEDDSYVISNALSQPFESLGNVRSSVIGDLDNDGDQDVVLGLEWGPVSIFLREGRTLVDRTRQLGLREHTGLWRSVALGDFDADGRLDIAAANAGWNTRYGRSTPVSLKYADLDANGLMDVFEVFELDGLALPARNLSDLAPAVPHLQSRFASHRQFASSTASDLWTDLDRVTNTVTASALGSTIFLNRGDHFVAHPLPVEAQTSTATGIAVLDANLDGHEDLAVGQNWFAYPDATPRQDAGRGLLLVGDSNGQFAAVNSGFRTYGEARGVASGDINHDGRPDIVFAQHAAPAHIYQSHAQHSGLKVNFTGPFGYGSAIGATVRLEYADGTLGPRRVVTAGSGLGSQSAPHPILGIGSEPVRVHIMWPGGTITKHALEPDQKLISVRQNE